MGKPLKFVPYGTEVDHSKYYEEICFLKQVEEKPVFSLHPQPEEVREGVWDSHFITAPDDRWEGNPRHRYRIRYHLPDVDPKTE